jgi:hypothetical protein
MWRNQAQMITMEQLNVYARAASGWQVDLCYVRLAMNDQLRHGALM